MSDYTVLVKLKQGDPHYLQGVSGLSWRSSWPGGFQTASFAVPALLVRHPAAVLSELNRVIISKGPVTVFDGEIRSVKRAWGTEGQQYEVTLYGYGVLLTDDLFGPRVYAINDLSRFALFNEPNNPAGSTEQTKKFEARQDDTSLRISAKAGSVFQGNGPTVGDFESYWYQLPKVAGQYVDESIKRVTFTYQTAFPTGSWALIIWEYDGTSVHTAVVSVFGMGPIAETYLPTLPNCKLIGFALRSTANQAIWPGYADDGAGSSLVHNLEYAAPWTPQLNYSQGGTTTNFHGQGIMYTVDASTAISTDKAGNNFYPDGASRNGGALRLQFTGSKIEIYSEKWSAYGDMEYRLYNDAGTLVTSGTINLNAATRAYQQKVLDYTPAGGFGSYTLTLRCLGTAGGAGSGYGINVDYFSVGVAGMAEFDDGDVYVDIRDLQVRTSPRLTGAVNCPAGTTTVNGTGTAFLSELAVGDHIAIPVTAGTTVEWETRRIATVTGDTTATVADAWIVGSASAIAHYGVTADRVAQDVIAHYSAAALGLSSDTSFVNEAAASPVQKTLTDLAPLAFDEPISGADVLDAICLPGTADDEPLGWAVFEDKVLRFGAWPLDPAAGYYMVDAGDADIEHEETIQDAFATIVAPLYKDSAGQPAIGADVTSGRITDEYAGRRRRVILSTDARDSTAAAAAASAYLANHDRPSARTRVTVRRPVRDRTGMVIPLDEVRPGKLARIVGLDEMQPDSATDSRSSLTALVVAVEYDAEAGTATLDLGDGPDSYERYLARIRKLEERVNRAV